VDEEEYAALAADLEAPLKELSLQSRQHSPERRAKVRSRSPLHRPDEEDVKRVEETLDEEEAEQEEYKCEILKRLDEEARLADQGANDTSLNSSRASEWFDNTHDEMLLFERYGENYDEAVAAMSVPEKRQLKAELAGLTPKTAVELVGEEALGLKEEERPFEEAAPTVKEIPETPQLPTPKPRTLTPMQERTPPLLEAAAKSGFSPRLLSSPEELKPLRDDLYLALGGTPKMGKPATPKRVPAASMAPVTHTPVNPFKTPEKKPRHFAEATSTASGGGRKKTTPLRATARTPNYLRPTSASKHRASPRKDPFTNEPVDVTICTRHGHCRAVYSPSHKPTTALAAGSATRRKLPSSVDMDKIVSPVAQYIRRNPAPPLIRQVREYSE